MGKCKKVCKMVKKDMLDDELKEYIKIVKDARYICTKCGRVAKKEDYLCKPEKM